MNITINGITFKMTQCLPTDFTVAHALTLYFREHKKPTVFAVAKNEKFVSQNSYDTTPIKLGDSLDVFAPIQGG